MPKKFPHWHFFIQVRTIFSNLAKFFCLKIRPSPKIFWDLAKFQNDENLAKSKYFLGLGQIINNFSSSQSKCTSFSHHFDCQIERNTLQSFPFNFTPQFSLFSAFARLVPQKFCLTDSPTFFLIGSEQKGISNHCLIDSTQFPMLKKWYQFGNFSPCSLVHC